MFYESERDGNGDSAFGNFIKNKLKTNNKEQQVPLTSRGNVNLISFGRTSKLQN